MDFSRCRVAAIVLSLTISVFLMNGVRAVHERREANVHNYRKLHDEGVELGRPNPLARRIMKTIPGVIALVPERCAKWKGPQAVYVTHANVDDGTGAGVEPFWEDIFGYIEGTSAKLDVCYVFTGYDPSAGADVPAVLIETLEFVSRRKEVVSIMASDPTDGTDVVEKVRMIFDSEKRPTIGMFNAGYANVLAESSDNPIPFIGPLFNEEFGSVAAEASGPADVAVCLNHRLGIFDFVGERCKGFVEGLNFEASQGAKCSEIEEGGSVFSAEEMQNIIADAIDATAGASTVAVYSEGECCENAVAAVANISGENPDLSFFVACADLSEVTAGLLAAGDIDVLTTQPVQLQAYTAATWASNPVLNAPEERPFNRKGAGEFFPSATTVVNTGIYAVPT